MRRPQPDYALVWKPPAELFARVRPAKAIFNLGAGVDVLLAVPTLPDGVPVIRLEDAGMAAQMAEYVTLAVLRAYREADAYAAQQREGRWQPRPRIAKSGIRRRHPRLRGAGAGRGGGARAFRLSASRLEPLPQGVRRASSRSRGAPNCAPFLAASQVLVCLLPSTPETRGLLDRAALEAPAARRPPRQRRARRHRRGRRSGRGARRRPSRGRHARRLPRPSRCLPVHPFWHHPRITLTPHASAVTLVEDSVAQVAGKIRRLERGEPVTGIVDRARGY